MKIFNLNTKKISNMFINKPLLKIQLLGGARTITKAKPTPKSVSSKEKEKISTSKSKTTTKPKKSQDIDKSIFKGYEFLFERKFLKMEFIKEFANIQIDDNQKYKTIKEKKKDHCKLVDQFWKDYETLYSAINTHERTQDKKEAKIKELSKEKDTKTVQSKKLTEAPKEAKIDDSVKRKRNDKSPAKIKPQPKPEVQKSVASLKKSNKNKETVMEDSESDSDSGESSVTKDETTSSTLFGKKTAPKSKSVDSKKKETMNDPKPKRIATPLKKVPATKKATTNDKMEDSFTSSSKSSAKEITPTKRSRSARDAKLTSRSDKNKEVKTTVYPQTKRVVTNSKSSSKNVKVDTKTKSTSKSKTAPAKSPVSTSKKPAKQSDMQDDQIDEDIEEDEKKNTKSKSKRSKSSPPAKKPVATKKKSPKTKSTDDAGDGGDGSSSSSSEEDKTPKSKPKRSKSVPEKKKKTPAPKIKAHKNLTHPLPDPATLKDDLDVKISELDIVDKDILYNNRNVIKAFRQKDKHLVRLCYENVKQISSFNNNYNSHQHDLNPLFIAIKNQDIELIKVWLIMHNKVKNQNRNSKFWFNKSQSEKRKRYETTDPNDSESLFEKWNQLSRCSMNKPGFKEANTGYQPKSAFGHKVRKLNLSRGSKLGNEAFLDYHKHGQNIIQDVVHNDEFIFFVFENCDSIDILELFMHYVWEKSTIIDEYLIYTLVFNNVKQFKHLVNKYGKQFEFNELMIDCLTKPLSELKKKAWKKASIEKKGIIQKFFQPMSAVCLSDDPQKLKYFIEQSGDINILDSLNCKPINYAALNHNPEFLRMLLEMGCSIADQDVDKETVIFWAVRAGRLENVKLIVSHASFSPLFVKSKNDDNMTILHFTCINDKAEILAWLLDWIEEKWTRKELTKLLNSKSNDSMTCMHECCRAGSQATLQVLIQKGMNVNYKDKFKRTPIFYAVMNGYLRMVDLLLRSGADPLHEDSSNNSLLHYAVGQNWVNIAKYLQDQLKLDLNKKNNWNQTPFSVSTVMRNPSTTQWILEKEEVDVNIIDDNGDNMLLMMLANFTLDEYSVAELRYLVEQKGCNLNVRNKAGNTALSLAMSVSLPAIPTQEELNGKMVKMKKVNQIAERDRNLQLYEEFITFILRNINILKQKEKKSNPKVKLEVESLNESDKMGDSMGVSQPKVKQEVDGNAKIDKTVSFDPLELIESCLNKDQAFDLVLNQLIGAEMISFNQIVKDINKDSMYEFIKTVCLKINQNCTQNSSVKYEIKDYYKKLFEKKYIESQLKENTFQEKNGMILFLEIVKQFHLNNTSQLNTINSQVDQQFANKNNKHLEKKRKEWKEKHSKKKDTKDAKETVKKFASKAPFKTKAKKSLGKIPTTMADDEEDEDFEENEAEEDENEEGLDSMVDEDENEEQENNTFENVVPMQKMLAKAPRKTQGGKAPRQSSIPQNIKKPAKKTSYKLGFGKKPMSGFGQFGNADPDQEQDGVMPNFPVLQDADQVKQKKEEAKNEYQAHLKELIDYLVDKCPADRLEEMLSSKVNKFQTGIVNSLKPGAKDQFQILETKEKEMAKVERQTLFMIEKLKAPQLISTVNNAPVKQDPRQKWIFNYPTDGKFNIFHYISAFPAKELFDIVQSHAAKYDSNKLLERRTTNENINPIFMLIKSMYSVCVTKPWNDIINQSNVFEFINKEVSDDAKYEQDNINPTLKFYYTLLNKQFDIIKINNKENRIELLFYRDNNDACILSQAAYQADGWLIKKFNSFVPNLMKEMKKMAITSQSQAFRVALLNNNHEIAKLLADSGLVDYQLKDMFGRNFFHLLLNELHIVDIDTKLVTLLITKNVDLNAQDIQSRTPLMYAFVSIAEFDQMLSCFNITEDYKPTVGVQKTKTFSKKDPIEVFTILVNRKITWDAVDVYGRNLVHQMAIRESSTCLTNLFTAFEQQHKSAKQLKNFLDGKDKDGNTPLNLSVMYGNMNFSNLLITKNVCDVNSEVYGEQGFLSIRKVVNAGGFAHSSLYPKRQFTSRRQYWQNRRAPKGLGNNQANISLMGSTDNSALFGNMDEEAMDEIFEEQEEGGEQQGEDMGDEPVQSNQQEQNEQKKKLADTKTRIKFLDRLNKNYMLCEQTVNIRMDAYRLPIETHPDNHKIIKDCLLNNRVKYQVFAMPRNQVTTTQKVQNIPVRQTFYQPSQEAQPFGGFGQQAGFGYNNVNPGFGGGFSFNQATPAQSNITQENNMNSLTHISLFRLILERNMEPLIHVLLAQNLSQGNGVMDGIRAFKFSLVNKILERVHEDSQLDYCNSDGQNLWHTIAMFSSTCPPLELLTIIKTFKNNSKIDFCKKDNKGRTQLHMAARFNNVNQLKQVFNNEGLSQKVQSIINSKDEEGKTVLQLILATNYNNVQLKSIIEKVLKFIDWRVYFKTDLKSPEVHYFEFLMNLPEFDFSTNVAQDKFNNSKLSLVESLVKAGMDINLTTTKTGNPWIMNLCTFNDQDKFSDLTSIETIRNKIDKKWVDVNKMGQLHHLAQFHHIYSFSNMKFIQTLIQQDQNSIKDSNGLDYYSYLQPFQKFNKDISNLLGDLQVDPIIASVYMKQLQIPQFETPVSNQLEDFANYIKSIQSKLHKKDPSLLIPPVDRHFIDKSVTHQVVKCTESGTNPDSSTPINLDVQYFDIQMVKVDLDQGVQGKNLFYIMQMVYDSNKELWVLFNRWGRIGHHGQWQMTPFTTFEEAEKTYSKIFQDKTGNAWKERNHFNKKAKKWQLIHKLKESDVKEQDIMQYIKQKKLDTTTSKYVKDDGVKKLINDICNYNGIYQLQASANLDPKQLTILNINKNELLKARVILDKLTPLIAKLESLNIKFDIEKIEEVHKVYDEIIGLSSNQQQIVPSGNQVQSPMTVINTSGALTVETTKIDTLLDCEDISKLLLGAQYKNLQFPILDQVYTNLNCHLAPLRPELSDYKMLDFQVSRSQPSGLSQNKVFRADRQCEIRHIEQESSSDKFLVFHGTRKSNLCGILMHGFKLNLLHSVISGRVFGNGTQFTDNYQTALSYSGDNCVLVCEVDMRNCGKVVRINQDVYSEYNSVNKKQKKLKEPDQTECDSLQVCGMNVPDKDGMLRDMNGVQIPCGKMKNQMFKPNGEYIENTNATQVNKDKEPEDRYYNVSDSFNQYVLRDPNSQVKIKYIIIKE